MDKKPKRKLSDISFENEGAHIALVSKRINNGPANLHDYAVVLKAKNNTTSNSISEETESDNSALAVEVSDTSDNIVHEVNKSEVSTSNSKNKKEKRMTQKEVKSETVEVKVEMIEKSAFEEIQKAVDAQKEELQKARDIIAQFEKEKKEAIVKSKTEVVKSAIKLDINKEAIVKASLTLESEEDFGAFVSAISQMNQEVERLTAMVQKSALFQEIGATTDPEAEVKKEDAVTRLVKAKYQKQ